MLKLILLVKGEIFLKNVMKIVLSFLLIAAFTIPFISLSVDASKKTSYLMDKKKLYTYSQYSDATTIKFKQKTEFGYDEWVTKDDIPYFAYKETKKGLYDSFTNKVISYPIKKGKVWYDKYNENYKYKIIDSKRTVKTKAGTFKNVIVVKGNDTKSKGYSVSYYAPNVGIILITRADKTTNYKSKKVFELIKLKSK